MQGRIRKAVTNGYGPDSHTGLRISAVPGGHFRDVPEVSVRPQRPSIQAAAALQDPVGIWHTARRFLPRAIR